jgi:penicillin-binding protein 1A
MRLRAIHLLQAVALLMPVTLATPPAGAALGIELPSIEPIVDYQPKLPLQVFTADGVEIAQFGEQRRQWVPFGKLPKLLRDAVVAVEDTRFREHRGIDPKGMARALLSMLTGGRRQGASTITQQLVRTMLLTHQFSAERKAKEIWLALKVEESISKDRILEIYCNEIFLGQRSYGFAAAAMTYFGKPLDKLGVAETAMLAGLPQNPYYANPIANLDRATRRQRIVLERMRAVGVIDDRQLAAARAEKVAVRSLRDVPLHAEHVAETARRLVVERFGAEAYSNGFRVYTSLKSTEQQAAWAALRRGVLAYERRHPWRGPEDHEPLPAEDSPDLERAAALALKDHRDDETLRVGIVLAASARELRVQLATGERVGVSGAGLQWALPALGSRARPAIAIKRGSVVRVQRQGDAWAIAQRPEVEAGFVALDPATGRVRALVGGFDFTRQPFDHVTQAWRQPGSAFKPLLYSAALERGVMPATVIEDAPFVAANGWAPQNSDGRFDGPLTLREALARSKNSVSIRLMQHVGVGAARDWAARFGLDRERQSDNLTLALGTGSVTPLQLAQAYAVFANGGWLVAPVLIERITDAQGKVLFEAPPPAPLTEDTRVLSARNAFVSASLLGDVTRTGTAARAQAVLKRTDVFGKTGTTDNAVDAWFAGFHPDLVGVAWLGYDTPRSLGDRESGGGAALPIWIDFMGAALKGVPVTAPPAPPEGLQRAGDEWIYSEWTEGGWVQRIGADASVQVAPPPAPPLPPPPLEQSAGPPGASELTR